MDEEQIRVTVNGEVLALAAGSSVSNLIDKLELKPERVAIEVDGLILTRSKWATTQLREGSRIEIVHFVGGGAPPKGI